MSSRSKRTRSKVLSGASGNVQNLHENTFLPPGAPVAGEEATSETQTTETNGGEAYPAVKVVDEAAHKAEEERLAQERVERANAVSAPKRLSEREVQQISRLIEIQERIAPVRDTMTVPIPMEEIPEDINNSFFQTGPGQRNLAQRNLARLIINPETKQPDKVELTEIGLEIYARQTTKGKTTTGKKQAKSADGKPKPVGKRSTRFTGLRLKILKPDARQPDTMGYFSWQLYQDGMTYDEYMAKKDWPETWRNKAGYPFKGPGLNHWTWDLEHGFIGLYRDGQPEFLEDGVTPNPKYWAIKNSPDPLEDENKD